MYLFHDCNCSSCLESTEIWHTDSFCAPVFFFFFKKAEKYGQNCVKIPPPSPLCPSLNNVGFRSLEGEGGDI